MLKVGVLILARERPGFDPEWGRQITEKVKHYLHTTEYNIFIPSVKITEDNSLREGVEECKQAKADILLVLQPVVSSGNLAASLSLLWPGPLVLWATPTRQDGDDIASNSLVGTHIFASALRQFGHPYELIYGMPGEKDFEEEFDAALHVAYTAARIRKSKVGLIGSSAPGFINIQYDPQAVKKKLGIQTFHSGVDELLQTMSGLDEAVIEDDVEKVLQLNIPLKDVEKDHLYTNSRYYLAFSQMIKDANLDGLAVRCWPELPNSTGHWPYLAFTRLLTEGSIIACEGDVDGAISCLMGKFLGFGSGYISDWLEHDEKTITAWHTGNAPLQLLEPISEKDGPKIARHFNDKKPVVVEGALRPDQDITLFRLWRCDDKYHMVAFEGHTIRPKRGLKGNNGLVETDGLNPKHLFYELCQAGMPHHLTVFAGHNKEFLKRLTGLLNIDWFGY